MSTAKFERLIDLIINEDQERAEQLFHEIVVEKSRQIYESLMDEEMCDEDMTSDLMDEIEMEETSDMTMEDQMEDEEMSGDYDVESDDESMDDESMDDESMDDEEVDMEMSSEEDFEDADMGSEEPASKSDVMDLEDKLDQLLAAFEEEFGSEEGEEEEEEEEEEEGEEESGVMEAVEMKKVSVTHTDGADAGSKRSTVASNSGARGMASKPVKFSGDDEAVPSSPKSPSNYGAKGQGSLPGAGSFQNSPGGAKGVKGGKGEAAAKPVKSQASGVNTKDVVPESRQIKKKIIR